MPASEHYPWTDDQVLRAFHAAQATTMGFDLDDIREILRGFHEAGIAVDIPVPRYRAMKSPGPTWLVVDTHATDNPYDDPTTVASFHARHGQTVGHPDPEDGARTEADRLNALA